MVELRLKVHHYPAKPSPVPKSRVDAAGDNSRSLVTGRFLAINVFIQCRFGDLPRVRSGNRCRVRERHSPSSTWFLRSAQLPVGCFLRGRCQYERDAFPVGHQCPGRSVAGWWRRPLLGGLTTRALANLCASGAGMSRSDPTRRVHPKLERPTNVVGLTARTCARARAAHVLSRIGIGQRIFDDRARALRVGRSVDMPFCTLQDYFVIKLQDSILKGS